MKLLYRITLRISAALLLLFAVWGTIFYFILIDEINDETDDSLEDYSEYIIRRALSGEALPDTDNGTNNTYYIREVDREYADRAPQLIYLDQSVYIFSKHETEPARILKTVFRDRNERYYELTVMIPTIEKDDLKETILVWIIILYLGLLVAIIIINALVLRRSLRPLYTMLEWLERFSLDKQIPPMRLDTDVAEFRKLSDSLVYNARRNVEIYEQQRLFIGHASHELQTPIAAAQNRLELLADDPSLGEIQLDQVIKAKRSLENISRLNKTLLLLSRIENRQFPETEAVDIGAILSSSAEDLAEIYAHNRISLSLDIGVTLRVSMNRMLAVVMMGNLVKNAFVHNRPGGTVTVGLSGRGVSVENTANNGALNPEYIFRPFFQHDKNGGGAGLGLSLVDSVARLYGISVEYRYEGYNHIFTVIFPSAMIISGK